MKKITPDATVAYAHTHVFYTGHFMKQFSNAIMGTFQTLISINWQQKKNNGEMSLVFFVSAYMFCKSSQKLHFS